MKENKFYKALIVIIIVGYGLVRNNYETTYTVGIFSPFSFNWDTQSAKLDSINKSESKIYIFTKKIINNGIKHLIPSL
jgi:hypothetical protein